MRLLLDTHAALWWLSGDEPFGERAEELLADGGHEVLLSAAVVWEIAIKRALGKVEAPDGLEHILIGAGASPLPVSIEHAAAVEHLPPHHRDPFDRILIAQAQIEGAALVSRDHALRSYDVPVIW